MSENKLGANRAKAEGERVSSSRQASTLAERMKDARRAYMDGALTFADYYCWLADEIGGLERVVPFSVERIRASHDEHLNDLPLIVWDSQNHVVQRAAFQAGAKAWSLSDTVCVLKALARRQAGGAL